MVSISKFYTIIFCIFLVSISLSSCEEEVKKNTKAEIKDDAENVFDFDKHPDRIVSLAPNITEALFAIGADSFIVGVSNYCDYPPETKIKKKVGSLLDPNLEVIASLNPDLIIMTIEGNSRQTYYSLKNLNYKVFVTNPSNVDGIIKMIKQFGIITGKKETADRIANTMQNDKDNFVSQNQFEVKQGNNCLMLISLSPLITVNKFTFINEIIELAGFKNLYRDELIQYPQINYEDVILKNPDYIFISCDTNDIMLKNNLLNSVNDKMNTTNGVKNKKVFPLDENVLSRPGPRVLECVRLLKNKL